MDSNHRFLGVSQKSLPLDHGTISFVEGGSRETRTHKRDALATCFRDRLLNQSDDFQELRGQESNLRTRRSRQRISTNRNYPAS